MLPTLALVAAAGCAADVGHPNLATRLFRLALVSYLVGAYPGNTPVVLSALHTRYTSTVHYDWTTAQSLMRAAGLLQ